MARTKLLFTYDEIRQWVLMARRKEGMSTEDIATFLGISESRVNEIENGRKPLMRPSTRERITAGILGEDPDWSPESTVFPTLVEGLDNDLTDEEDDMLAYKPLSEKDTTYLKGYNQGREDGLTTRDRIGVRAPSLEVEVDDGTILEFTVTVRRRQLESAE